MAAHARVRCGIYMLEKKRSKFGLDEFIQRAATLGVDVVVLDLDGPEETLPTNLDVILHKVNRTSRQCIILSPAYPTQPPPPSER